MIGYYKPRKRGAQITQTFLRGVVRGALRGLGDVLASTDIASLAAAAGFNGSEVPIAVAIAMAESSGDPGAIGDKDIGNSYGLWQIYLPLHPEFTGWNLLDPMTNARAAYSVYQRQGWNAWTTYKSGAYRRYVSNAGFASTNPAPPSPLDTGAPLTIDAATGQVIQDNSPTPVSTGATPTPAEIALGIAAAAAAAALLASDL